MLNLKSAPALRIPRALGRHPLRIRADANDPGAMMTRMSAAFDEFKATYDGRFKTVQDALDSFAIQMAAREMGAGHVSTETPEERDYKEKFNNFFRHGAGEHDLKAQQNSGQRGQILASMSQGSASDGGYLAPVEWDRKIIKSLRVVSSMRSVAKIVETSTQAYQTLWDARGWGSGWVGEQAPRPATASGQLQPIVFPTGEIYAMPAATQRLLDDASINLEQWISDSVSEEFAAQEGIAFISGDGVNKPMGLLRYIDPTLHPGGAIGVTLSGNAGTLSSDSILELTYRLPSTYRQNAKWIMNSMTAFALRKLKDGQGNYLWQANYIAGQPETLVGYPIVIDENMPDVAAGSYPIAFGDWQRAYVINDRIGVRVLRDPYTNKPYVMFYTTKRVGGGMLDIAAARLLKVGAA